MENDELLIVKCSIEIFRHVMYLDKNKRKHVPKIWIEELNLPYKMIYWREKYLANLSLKYNWRILYWRFCYDHRR